MTASIRATAATSTHCGVFEWPGRTRWLGPRSILLFAPLIIWLFRLGRLRRLLPLRIRRWPWIGFLTLLRCWLRRTACLLSVFSLLLPLDFPFLGYWLSTWTTNSLLYSAELSRRTGNLPSGYGWSEEDAEVSVIRVPHANSLVMRESTQSAGRVESRLPVISGRLAVEVGRILWAPFESRLG